MQQKKPRYPLGAHLIVKHFGYSHHGIYAGRGRVIHYSGFAHIFKKHPIEITSLQRFARNKVIYIRNYPSPRYQAKAVVKRMRSRMHENNYHLIINNCEHLCTWAITGVESSTQVERMQHRLATIGYVSSVMSYMNSLMLTVATACFAIVLYIKMMLRRQAKKSTPTYLRLKAKHSKK
ncbi:lecithin retinol acyltransferase family protein [Acinetobacter sp. NIPH 2699]|uniref:lecithin retinol acyltransferase family protein n=1 Tax=Acinetobacter sp. NIPH 2699 TaxID=2923433 RepID=UPI001F4B36F9|nr:lecithin retinol acyltransferase family protein [Acinetobacter sp. NIPH 2699]MCH7336834.1 lecithin retinol acyltransferase family protein [Acinetobacter sp. NIPH 2699]